MAEGEGFEPPVRFPVRLISSQVPLTTQPPFQERGTLLCSFFEPGQDAIGVAILTEPFFVRGRIGRRSEWAAHRENRFRAIFHFARQPHFHL